MRLFALTISLVIFFSVGIQAQAETMPEEKTKELAVVEIDSNWTLYKTEDYELEYPSDWTVDESKLMGSEFILFSPWEKDDEFRENMNLIVEDVSGFLISLDQYAELSEKQLVQGIADIKFIRNERQKRKGLAYQELEYTGRQGVFKLHFLQRYWMVNGNVYVLTFTADAKSFKDYLERGTMILDSFELLVH